MEEKNTPTPPQQPPEPAPPSTQPTQPITDPSLQFGSTQPGLSASQLGLNEPKKGLLNINVKKLIIGIIGALIIIAGIITALVLTNVIALTEFKTVRYTTPDGTNFALSFYSRHGINELNSGGKQLVSKVSKGGKLPVTLLLSSPTGTSSYNRLKDCSGARKVMEVQNDNLNQTITLCDYGESERIPADGIYLGGFMHNEKAYIVTIGQDLGGMELTSPQTARESLEKVGLTPYKANIDKIVSSIKVE